MWILIIPVFLAIGWFSPWWILVPLSLFAGLTRRDILGSAGVGFIVSGAVWGFLIATLDFQSHGIVSSRLSDLFGVNNKYVFVVAVPLGAAMVGAISGLLGHWIRRLVIVPR